MRWENVSSTARVGLTGCGGVAGAHMRAYRQMKRLEVISAAEIIPDRFRSFGGDWGIEELYIVCRDML